MLRQDLDLAWMLQYENIAWYEDGKVYILDRRIYPIDVKKVEVIGWRQFAHVKKRNMRKNLMPNSKYVSLPVPKRESICRGKSWNIANATSEIAPPAVIARKYAFLTRLYLRAP